uniref:PDZ domain-containing protein n=1 Tax=Cryptomonas curvata TaxID=233186 RepID=A0A7S0MG07_9CRYP|mmetsp:Transcript_39425/g.82551  ORF Transcript_39425/g.82551 Transcript_39425/m.82551 type:complete len:196 (+) Transcript_39425:202-789(+)
MGEVQSCLQCDAKREPKPDNLQDKRRAPTTPNTLAPGPGRVPSGGQDPAAGGAPPWSDWRSNRSVSRTSSAQSSRQPSPSRRDADGTGYEKAKVGIGVYFQRSKEDEGALVVKSILKGSPSQLSNKVFVGDVILAVNGDSVYGKSLAELAEKLLGPSGTVVECTFQNGATKEVTTLSLPRGITADRYAQAYLAAA